MSPRALTKPLILVCLIAFSCHTALPQEIPPSEEIRSMLHAASTLIPAIDKAQQPSLAFNISGLQMRMGDLSGALATVQSVENKRGRIFSASNVASMVAWQGSLSTAIELIRTSADGNREAKAEAYRSVAGQLARKHAFQEALKVAQLIEDYPPFFGQTNLFVDTLMRIRNQQWEAGDQPGAETSLNTALDAARREAENPFTPEFAQSMPASLYGTIASELAREGNREAALGVLDRIYALVAAAQTANQRQSTWFYWASSLAAIRELRAAENMVEQLEPGQQREGVMMLIAIRRTDEGNALVALDEALALSYEPWRNISLSVIANALAGSGNYVQALSTIDRIQGAGERVSALSGLALQQAEKDDAAAALTVELAWQAATDAGSETKPYVFGQIAVARGILGDFVGAMEIVGTMAEQDRVWPLQNLTAMLVHAGKKMEAIALAESEDAPRTRACAFLGIASQLISEQRDAINRNEPRR
jgi:tetratricopeptide (TPR) repeat protein